MTEKSTGYLIEKPIAELLPYINNSRTHTEHQIDQVAASIKEFGFLNPVIIDQDGMIIAGHCRVSALRKLKRDTVPCIVAEHLTPLQIKAYIIADNKLAENAGWDEELLRIELEALKDENFDIDLIGFDQAELDALFKIATAEDGETNGTLQSRFIAPPFSVLDAKQGYWQDRKREWIGLGITSGDGRDAECLPDSIGEKYGRKENNGVSVFDPVLCEVAYTWFTPQGATILDPFAGGSVRGVVAALLGRQYVGVDLRPEQVEENIKQWATISQNISPKQTENGLAKVKISAAMARLRFNGCDPEYIKTTCKASCCESSTAASGIVVTVHPSEIKQVEAHGATVKDGLLQPKPGQKKCPFKNKENLCGLHFTPDKPFGCIASPFTLNKNGTLIVRNRYKMLKCYDDGAKIPAYKAFRASLDLIFGLEESARICEHFDNGGGDINAYMTQENYKKLLDNDNIKKGIEQSDAVDPLAPIWHIGDSRNIQSITENVKADFIFSCPPYADLEVYSDHPNDISNLEYEQFIPAYNEIIAKACAMLNDNRFACFVVGDIRDKKGLYRNFVSDTIAAFTNAGLSLYNEAIFVTPIGTLPVRAAKAFTTSRKLGKAHQNVLVFVKGSPKEATTFCGDVEIMEVEN